MPASVLEKMGSHPGLRALFERAQRRELPRNHVVIALGDRAEHLYLLLAGRVSIQRHGAHGQELLLDYCYPGDFFGEMGLFPGVEERSAVVKTVMPSTTLRIAYPDFIALSHAHPDLWLELAGQLAERLRTMNHRLAERPASQAAERVWNVIVEMAQRMRPSTGGGKVIHITRRDLGRLAGCSRELAGMVVAEFARNGRLRLRGRSIIVPPELVEG